MGKHSYVSKTPDVSSFLPVESRYARAHHRGLLGRLAIRAGATLAALTTAGVALFGVSQVNALSHSEPVRVSYDAGPDANAKFSAGLRESLDEAENDFQHLMGALGAFTILTTAGVGLMAQQTSRRYYRRPEDEVTQINRVVHPFMFSDEDDPDMPSSTIAIEPIAVYLPHERSLVDDLLGEYEFEESYA
jgi:hypothetical protein